MSFPKSKRFEAIKACAPPPGSYDPRDLKHTPAALIEKSERFGDLKDKKDDMRYGSDSALEISSMGTPKKMLFKAPLAQPSGKSQKKDKKKEEFIDPNRIKDLEKELKSLTSERVNLDKRLASREEEVTRLESRLQEAHREKTKLVAKVATIERQVSSMNKSNETLKQKLSATDNTQSKQKALAQELSHLQTELDKHTKEAKQLREQLEQTKTQKDTDVNKAKMNLSKLQEEFYFIEKQHSNAQEEIEKLKKTIAELKEQKLDLEKQIEETREELANSKNKHDELLSEVQKSLENKVTSLSEQETILNNNIEALTNKYQVLESNFAAMQSEHEITEAQLRREVSALKHSLADLQETNDQLTSVNAELLDRLSLEKDEVTILEKKLAEAECITNDKFELLTTYLDSKTAEINNLRQLLNEKQTEMSQIAGALDMAKQAARHEVDTAKETAAAEVDDMKKALEQKSLEEQDLRWQLERALKQVVEYQELAEVKQEELNMIQAQQEEGERETSEEMDIIHHRMEEVEAQHQSDINKYKARIQELEKMSETDKKAFLEGFKTKELELKEKIKTLEEEMAAAEKASFQEIEQIKRQTKVVENRYQDQIKALQTDMAGCEMAAQQEISKLKETMQEEDKSAHEEIQSLGSRLAEMRLQNNEVIDELKAQVTEAKQEYSILVESNRRATEAQKTTLLQREQELMLCRTELESVRLELDTERADNACTVRRLEEERERDQDIIERSHTHVEELENQLEDAESLLASQVTNLEEALKVNTHQMNELRSQVESAELSAKEAEKAANAEVEEIKAEMVRAEEVAKQQLQQFDDQLKSLQDQARKEVEDLNKHLEDVRVDSSTELNSLRSQIKLRDDEIARLNAHLIDAEQVANSVKEKCGTLKEELSRLTKDNESALSRVEAKYQKQLDSQKEEHEAELARRSCEDGAQHHVDIQEMAKAYQELQAKYDVLEKLIGPFQEQLQAFESEKQILLGSKTNVEIEITKLSEEYARLLGHQNQKQKIKHVLKLKHENNTLKQDLLKSREEVSRLRRQVTKFEDRRTSEGGRKFAPTKAFSHAKENQTPPVSPLRAGNRI